MWSGLGMVLMFISFIIVWWLLVRKQCFLAAVYLPTMARMLRSFVTLSTMFLRTSSVLVSTLMANVSPEQASSHTAHQPHST